MNKTNIQQNIIRFVIDYKSENGGNSPTVDEIAFAVGRSKSSVNYQLNVLAFNGLILRGMNTNRMLDIPGSMWSDSPEAAVVAIANHYGIYSDALADQIIAMQIEQRSHK